MDTVGYMRTTRTEQRGKQKREKTRRDRGIERTGEENRKPSPQNGKGPDLAVPIATALTPLSVACAVQILLTVDPPTTATPSGLMQSCSTKMILLHMLLKSKS